MDSKKVPPPLKCFDQIHTMKTFNVADVHPGDPPCRTPSNGDAVDGYAAPLELESLGTTPAGSTFGRECSSVSPARISVLFGIWIFGTLIPSQELLRTHTLATWQSPVLIVVVYEPVSALTDLKTEQSVIASIIQVIRHNLAAIICTICRIRNRCCRFDSGTV